MLIKALTWLVKGLLESSELLVLQVLLVPLVLRLLLVVLLVLVRAMLKSWFRKIAATRLSHKSFSVDLSSRMVSHGGANGPVRCGISFPSKLYHYDPVRCFDASPMAIFRFSLWVRSQLLLEPTIPHCPYY
jgi:hypothetical protein